MSSVLFLRHGETEWNVQRRLQGRLESPLTEAGLRQAADAAVMLPDDFDLVVASDLERARGTVRPYVDRHAVEVRFDSRLRERSWGEWEGLSHDEVEAVHPGWRERGMRAPDHETDDMVWARVEPVIEELRSIDGRVLCVTHGGVIGVIARTFGGDARRIGNVEGVWLDVTPARTIVGPRQCFTKR
jgi:glucosyl-3-phosphoglycerate phosphatase